MGHRDNMAMGVSGLVYVIDFSSTCPEYFIFWMIGE